MTRRRLFVVIALLAVLVEVGVLTWGVVFPGTFSPGADDVLKLVPDSAWGIVLFNKPASLNARFRSLVNEMKAPPVDLLARLKEQAGVKTGQDENGTAGVILLPPDRKAMPPTTVALIPVIDYSGFVKNFHAGSPTNDPLSQIRIGDVPYWIRHVGRFAAIVDGSHRDAISDKKLSPAKTVPPALTPWRDWLVAKDAACLILQPGVRGISTQVQEGATMAKAALTAQMVANAVRARSTEQAKMATAALDVCSNVAQSAEKGVTAVGFGVYLDKQNVIRVVNRAALVPDGPLAGTVAETESVKRNLLTGLPNSPFAFAGGAAVSEPVCKALVRGAIHVAKALHSQYGMTKKQADQLSEMATELLEGVEILSFSLGVGPVDQPPFSNSVAVIRVEDSDKFLKQYEAAIREYGNCVKDAKNPVLQPVDVETIRWGGVTALQVTSNVSASLPPNGKGVPEFAQNMQQLFGPDGKLVAWIVPANEHRIVIGYEDKEHLRQIVEAIQQGSEGLGANSEATGLPSGNAAMVGCLSPSGTVDFIQRMLAVLLPPNVRAAMTVPPFPQTPPIRFTMNISRDALENNLVVPAEFLRAIVPYSEELQAAGAKAAERPVPPDTQGEKKAPEAAATPSS